MMPFQRVVSRGFVLSCQLCGLFAAREATAQSTTVSGFAAGVRDIVNLDFAATPVGEFPKGLRLLQGNLEVVDKDGMHMLRASTPSEFVMHLPEVLPKDFTVEFELIPKACCNPEDLMLEGVLSGSRSSVSAQLTWHPAHLMVVGGNSDMFQMDMPAAIAAVVPSALTKVSVSFEDETVKMYTNGRRLFTLNDRKFVRGRVMRIFLGGQDEDKYAVYLARLRIADLAPVIVAQNAPQAGPRSVSPMPSSQPNAVTPPPGAAAATVPAGFNITVALSSGGPVVSWPPISGASGYTVSRYKIDDVVCCNSSSGRGWLSALSWQDTPPPVSGRYVYLVLASTSAGQLRGQATFDYSQPATSPTVTPPMSSSLGSVPSRFTVSVMMGSAGPLVSWSPVPNATVYAVDRYKIDDQACCGSSSGRTPATSPWQDLPLPVSGTYLYVVTAYTAAGQLYGQTQFGFRLPGGTSPTQPAPAPVNAVLMSPTTTGTITPTPTNSNSPAPVATAPTKPSSPTVMSNAAAPTDLTAQGSPVSVYLEWTPVQGAVRYEISRAVQGTPSQTALGTPPNYADATYFRDNFPSHTTTYTYEVAAFQADGSYGKASVDFTPPAPADPANFTAKQTGPGQVEFEWDFVAAGASRYFLSGPGTGNGTLVYGGAHMPGTKNHYTLTGIPAGAHTWTVATNWEPGGILTPSTAWPKATATITAAGSTPTYRLVALGFRAIAQSKDIDDAKDGHGDEVYFSAIVNRAQLTGLPLPVTKGVNLSMVMTRSHGDEAVSVPYGRIRAGTASATGGIQSGDAVPVNLDPAAPTSALQTLTFPLLVWEGQLPDSDVVVVHPVLWEDDVNPVAQATWAKILIDAATSGYVNLPPVYDGYISSGTIFHHTAERIYGFNAASLVAAAGIRTIANGLEPDLLRSRVPGNGLFQCTILAFNLTRRPCEAHGVDRPLGLEAGPGGGFSTDWVDRVIVLTRTTVEAALSGSMYAPYSQWPRGTFSLKLLDQVATEPLDIEAIASYELFFRIERVP